MKVLYHLTSPPPVFAGTDAVFQEIELLRGHFGGALINLFPLKSPSLFYPKPLYGLHRLPTLKRNESEHDLHHVYYATLYPFPYLRVLNKPVIYSVVSGLPMRVKPTCRGGLKQIHTIVINNDRDKKVLEQWGIDNYRVIRPGFDAARFDYTPFPFQSEFILLVGSAPWVGPQFRQKGIDLLLDAAAHMDPLKLIFLWRGRLADELETRIARHGIASKVEIINCKVDVNRVLARAHASVVLAETPKLVKAYPHSLLESLAAGKPVLVSAAIPMADYVSATKCGVVLPRLDPADLFAGIGSLMRHYGELQTNALRLGCRDFSVDTMLAAFERLYREAMA